MPIENARVRAAVAFARPCTALIVLFVLTACGQTTSLLSDVGAVAAAGEAPDMPHYRALTNERFLVPAVSARDLDPKYVRQVVRYPASHPAGTIVVDPDAKFLYLVMEDGAAMRYGIGVGREGFGWSGTAQVARKASWPRWTPPAAMIRRQPELEPYRHGMEPGLDNPLGARALYLYQDGRDTLYRIHGTNEPWSIGHNVSSGCIRLLNQDIIDLFGRVPAGAQVIVLSHGRTAGVVADTAAADRTSVPHMQ
jgi:lipoprotein-anchoring transpeptidase ErfK/SrfK